MKTASYDALALHARKQSCHHMAISGDLVNLALPQEFSNARAKIEALGAPDSTSLVFGNHDAYVRGALKEACAVFAPWIKGDDAAKAETEAEYGGQRQEKSAAPAAPAGVAAGETPFIARAAAPRAERAAFSAPASRAHVGSIYGAPAFPTHARFPYLRVRGETALIGVSSAIATPPFCAAGYFGRAQALALAALLRAARQRRLFRIILIHHPPLAEAAAWRKKLWGIKRFQQVLEEEGAELVLHGHTHLPSLSFLPSRPSAENPQGRAAVVGVSSAAQEFGGAKPPASYNMLEIDKNFSGLWQCRLSRFALVNAKNEIGCVERKILFG